MGGKRKSQGGDSGKKNRRIEDCLEGAQALLSGAQKSVKTFNEWLSKVIEKHDNVNNFLKSKCCDEASLLAYLRFVDTAFPPPADLQYVTPSHLNRRGGVLLRPWHLVWMSSAGFKGFCEPDQLQMLCEMIVAQGFLTDPDCGATEKLSISSPVPGSMQGVQPLAPTDIQSDGTMVGPMSLLFVKGWTRSLAATVVMMCCFENEEFLKELSPDVKGTFAVIHATVLTFDSSGSDGLANFISQNRGMTLQSTSVRRRPNCFNILHQYRLLKRQHDSNPRLEEVWSSISGFQQALSIGKGEATAAHNLLLEVDPRICERLVTFVQKWSMHKFIAHEPIAQGLFNTSHNTASSSLQHWDQVFGNSLQCLNLLCDRLAGDFESLAPKMRKPYSMKDVECLQRLCASWIASLQELKNQVSDDFYTRQLPALNKSFLNKHADADLQNIIEQKAPPIDIGDISILRSVSFAYRRQAEEQRDAEMEKIHNELQACSLRQCEVNISKDVFAMVEWSKLCREASNREGHLDVKFLNARYNKGVKQVQDFMEANHKYFETSIGLQDAQAEILKFQRKFDNGNGQMLLIFDCSSWPGRVEIVDQAVDCSRAILNGNENAALLVLTPVQQSNAERQTVIKKRRVLEDKLMAVLDVHEVSICFNDTQHANDRRRRSQMGYLCLSQIHAKPGFLKSKAILGTVGPVDRTRVMDLVNMSDDRPLTPAARVMQKGVAASRKIMELVMEGTAMPDNRVMVVDLCMNRYNEWGQACWQIQHQTLTGGNTHSWKFVAVHPGADDHSSLDRVRNVMSGKMLSEWWDASSEAGPKQRPRSSDSLPARPNLEVLAFSDNRLMIPALVLDKFNSNNSSMVTALDKSKQEVDDWNEKWGSGLAVQVGAGAASGGTPSDVVESIVACNARTGCQPEFEETEMPIDTMKDFIFPPDCVLAKADFESNHEVLACATSLINEKVLVYITKSWKLFLVNTGDGDVSLNAGEVFGFNLGAFQEKPTGVAKSERSLQIPFLINKDSDLVVSVTGQRKTAVSIAHLICQGASQHGITECSMANYDLANKTKDDGSPLNFRYTVSPKARLNCFFPKAIETEDLLNLRGTLVGAVFINHLEKVPSNDFAKILFEVTYEPNVPAIILPKKPKYWLLGRTTLKSQYAYQIKG